MLCNCHHYVTSSRTFSSPQNKDPIPIKQLLSIHVLPSPQALVIINLLSVATICQTSTSFDSQSWQFHMGQFNNLLRMSSL